MQCWQKNVEKIIVRTYHNNKIQTLVFYIPFFLELLRNNYNLNYKYIINLNRYKKIYDLRFSKFSTQIEKCIFHLILKFEVLKSKMHYIKSK